MPYDETADLIGSAEATLDIIALLLGDISEEVRDTPGTWNIAEILNHLLDAEGRYFARVRAASRAAAADEGHARRRRHQADGAAGVEAFLRAPAAPHPPAALAEARRVETLRHADPARQGHDRRRRSPHGRSRRCARGADRPAP